jgi:hypothetical protein
LLIPKYYREFRISSLPKGQSWLSDSDPQRNWKNIFTPPESNNVTLSAYFKQKRCRGSSISSDNSSIDGNKLKSRASGSSNRYDFDPASIEMSQSCGAQNDSVKDKIRNTSEYELQVEPASPNDNDSMLMTKNTMLSRTYVSSTSSPKIAPYESTGGDHIHTDVFSVSEKVCSNDRNAHSQSPTGSFLNSAADRDRESRSMNSNIAMSCITTIAPRPRFGLSREIILSPQEDFENSSLSPSLYVFQRSSSENIARDEAAREATRARKTSNTGNY